MITRRVLESAGVVQLPRNQGIIGAIVGLFIVIIFEVKVFPSFDPILETSLAAFGLMGGPL